jgi:UDP-glucuronate 4-epimerase
VDGAAPYRLYNIGNSRSEALMDFIGLVEQSLGKKAEYHLLPMQPGDVKETYADISAIERDIGFAPTTPISVGIPRFVEWFKAYHAGLESVPAT